MSTVSDLAALSTLLSSLSEAHHDLSDLYGTLATHLDPRRIDPQVLVVARAIQGEEAGQFGKQRDELGELVAHIAYNRWQQPWWKQIDGLPCTFAARVEYDWHGTQRIHESQVEPWALRIAYQVLNDRRNGGEDGAHGALFAMTLDDLQAHGWEEGGREALVYVITAPHDPLVQFWMMDDDPAKEGAQ